jgi:hypothetical protein
MQTTTMHDGEPKRGNTDDHEYDSYLNRIAARFTQATASGEPLFTTDAHKRHDTTLWGAYLNSFPADERQFHNCDCCRRFINHFGTLVTIGTDGRTTPAIWNVDDAHELYKPAVEAMARLVRRAKVTGIFMSEESALGRPVTGVWKHFAVLNPRVFKRTTKTAKQAMATRREDHHTVARALSEITPAMLTQAVTLLQTESLYRSEKFLAPAQWLLKVSEERRGLTGTLRDNALWRAIAGAPEGFCHPRSGMIGSLLEDIEKGLPFDEVRRKFAAKVAPLAYQRPQAAPTAGNIAVAEKLVAELGIAPSLRRRFARLDEVLEKLWEPKPSALRPGEASGGVFGHLKPKGDRAPDAMRIPPMVMTWEKFARTILPTVEAIEVLVPVRGSFSALVTAAVPDAPPILQWDLPERRNPLSWYLYSGGSLASQWGLVAGSWAKVTAIASEPPQWFGGHPSHTGQGSLFVLEGARDTAVESAGLGLFPECLKSELREVRATIEAFSKAGTIEGLEEASACGLKIKKGQACAAQLRVFGSPGTLPIEYQIDRWD